MPLVVSIASLMFPFRSSLRSHSRLIKDSPEYGPGAIFGAEGVYTSSASTPSASASSIPLPIHSHSGSHAGPIAGGAVGGIAVISIAVAAIFYIRRRRQRRSPGEAAGAGASEALGSDDGTDRAASPTWSSTAAPQQSPTETGQPMAAMKLYVRRRYDYVPLCVIFLLFPYT